MTPRDKSNPVTDHAVLRYLERERGIDIEAIRNEMATPIVRAACAARASKVLMGGTEFRICSTGKVRTVVTRQKSHFSKRPAGQSKGHRKRKKRLNNKITRAEREANWKI